MTPLWSPFKLRNVVFVVFISQIVHSKATSDPKAVNHKDFNPSYKVLFRRSDTEGELLLPSVPPFLGNLQTSQTNNINSYANKPTYGAQQRPPTCLLRTCDQYVTGRDLSYERALEIVQNEEYLVAVDADLIRRRQDYGAYGLDAQASNNVEWSLPLDQHLDLTQYVATAGKRKKREAEAVAEAIALANPDDLLLQPETRFWNISSSTATYNDDILLQYLRYGIAGALLLGVAATLPAPEQDVLPVDLPSSKSDHIEKIGQKIKQNYQERFNFQTPQIPQINFPNPQQISKRQLLDALLPFRRKPAGPRPGGRPKRKPDRRPGILPKPIIQKAPPQQSEIQDTLIETITESELGEDARLEFESGGNPLLSKTDFNKFFPSWSSRKKRATLIQESRLFNFTGSGFATLSYPWTDVIGTYINYAITGGLILALTSFLSAPGQNIVPLQLPTLPDSVLPKINPVDLPPNLPEGLVPPGNPIPGTPGGGAKPIGNTPEAVEAIALIPRGSIPVAVFPPYATPRTVPAVSVIFLETPTPSLVKRQGIWGSIGSGISNWSRQLNCYYRKKRDTAYAAPTDCNDYSHLKYGFRTRVSLVENQSCILDVTCTATGDRIDVALAQRRSSQEEESSFESSRLQPGSGFAKRQLEEFSSDAPPDCRAIRDPTNSCLSFK